MTTLCSRTHSHLRKPLVQLRYRVVISGSAVRPYDVSSVKYLNKTFYHVSEIKSLALIEILLFHKKMEVN